MYLSALGLIYRFVCIVRSSNSTCGCTYRLLEYELSPSKKYTSEPEILRLAGAHYPRSQLLIKT